MAKEQQRNKRRQADIGNQRPERSSTQGLSQDYELERAISELPPPYRQVVLLRYYRRCSCKQVAEQLDVPVGTVTKRLSRAYAMLRESLGRRETD